MKIGQNDFFIVHIFIYYIFNCLYYEINVRVILSMNLVKKRYVLLAPYNNELNTIVACKCPCSFTYDVFNSVLMERGEQ